MDTRFPSPGAVLSNGGGSNYRSNGTAEFEARPDPERREKARGEREYVHATRIEEGVLEGPNPSETHNSSILSRGRPKAPPRPSSFFGVDEPDDGRERAPWDEPGEEYPSNPSLSHPDLVTAPHDFSQAPTSLHSASRIDYSASTKSDSNPALARRSSFYGVDSQLPPGAAHPSATLQPTRHDLPHGTDSTSTHSSSDPPTVSTRNTYNQFPGSANSFPISSNQNGGGNSRATSLYGINPSSSIENVAPPAPLLDQSHLHPGVLASLLTHEKTLDLYRMNAKKTGDPDVQFEFCTFVMEIVGEMESAGGVDMKEMEHQSAEQELARSKQQALVAESVGLLSKLANRGHVKSQYFLADCYTQGIGTPKNKRDFDKAFPLFVLAAKHGHADACFRAAQCCENGWGCKRDFSKACTYLRKAAITSHPPAMHRLGLAEMNGEIGLTKRPREGVKWIKRAAELADQVDPPQPQSLHELAMLNEKGIDNIIFVDLEYAAELYARASELGYAPSAYKLGECYEYGKMGCPQDSALSIHYYNIAAQQDHREACFALTAWYLVGSPGVLPQSDTEAYLWAKKAAGMGLAKAEYAFGYFTEVGIGCHEDAREALEWFGKAAEHGDKRARDRLRIASSQGIAIPRSSAYFPSSEAPRSGSDYGAKAGKLTKEARLRNQSNNSLPPTPHTANGPPFHSPQLPPLPTSTSHSISNFLHGRKGSSSGDLALSNQQRNSMQQSQLGVGVGQSNEPYQKPRAVSQPARKRVSSAPAPPPIVTTALYGRSHEYPQHQQAQQQQQQQYRQQHNRQSSSQNQPPARPYDASDPYAQFDDSSALPLDNYGRPPPIQRDAPSNKSSRDFKALSASQARMPARQQMGSLLMNGAENGRRDEAEFAVHRERVLHRGGNKGEGTGKEGKKEEGCSIM